MTYRLLCFLTLFCGTAATGQTYQGISHYKVVKNRSRTTPVVTSGEITSELKLIENHDTPVAFTKYKVKVRFFGSHQGHEILKIPSHYFTTAFMEQLRKDGIYIGPNFKVKHLGRADAKDHHGKVYKNGDRLLFYDLNERNEGVLGARFRTFNLRPRGEILNAEILAMMHPGIPGIGAVTIDMRGSLLGMTLKIGADLTNYEWWEKK